ncbi:hypothetical protein ABZ307_28460 [Streptomyces griseorubiginosus]|uniref:hypothetical protein n=1 Tax=Streptomyces griseorubiginosus TaxID=67304 RepID=UPI0033A9E013
MAKESGLGDGLFVQGFDLSGDIQQVNQIGSPRAVIDVTGIDKKAYERIYGIRDGVIDMTTHFNTAVGQQFPTLKQIPDTDTHVMYRHGTTLGNPAAALVAKRTSFEMTRSNEGAVTFAVNAQANAYGLEWGVQLTAGKRTDTTGTNGTSVDQTTASTSFGWQAYLQVFAVTGTSVTVKIQDSADNSSWADLSGAAFTAATTAGVQRIQAASATATVRRYVRVVSSGTFTNAQFAVMFNRNSAAVTF